MTFRNILFYWCLLCLYIPIKAQTTDFPYTLPTNFKEVGCTYQIDEFEMSIVEKYVSQETDVSNYFSAVAGDLDGDGFSEIVIPGGGTTTLPFIYIFNHKAELIKKIDLPEGCTLDINHDSVILSDLNNDGKGEIIVTASNGQKLLIYNIEGTLLASTSFPTKFPKTTGVADFNKDGFPEIYAGTSIYSFNNNRLTQILNGGNTLGATVAQDINNDGYLDLVSVNTAYEVRINSTTNASANTIRTLAQCNEISVISQQRERTFALADIDLDGKIEIVTVVPIKTPESTYKLEVKIWDISSQDIKYALDIPMDSGLDASRSIRNSWPFIGDTDANSYPDIIFMGGINLAGHTSIYRLEYDKNSRGLAIRGSNNQFNDFSSMSTSMSMFDFNNDHKYEIVYRDESSLYIIDGETLTIQQQIKDCYSGTGWEYPIIVSLTPGNESFVVMSSGKTSSDPYKGTLRIYGADVANGAQPWMPARKIWNQYSFYQNTINDNLTTIANPAPLNYTLTSSNREKRLQPFNGHMTQQGIINLSTLEYVYPAADVLITSADFGHDKVNDKLLLNINISNHGEVDTHSNATINIYQIANNKETLIASQILENGIKQGELKSFYFTIDDFSKYIPYENILIRISEKDFDCNYQNNEFTISPDALKGVFYVKKGSEGSGKSWEDAMGELSEALIIAKERNQIYPNSITQIWVAEGTYYDNFEMQEGVNIYGGFKGDETAIKQSRPLEYPTILDAGKQGRPLTQPHIYKIPTEWRGLTLQNGVEEGLGGGALLLEGSTLSYSIVRNNTASQAGGVYLDNSKIINCIIEGNTVSNTEIGQGAGIYAINNSVVINNTIVKNEITTTSLAEGAGVYASSSNIYNNIIYKNIANNKTNNLYTQESASEANLTDEKDAIDPLFINFTEGDYQLLPISPALNNGVDTHIEGWTIDIAGNPRIYKEATVDQGAFEYQAEKLNISTDGSLYVNEKKNGNGANWEDALQNLSDAITGAKLLNEANPNTVSKIWVAGGTYQGAFEMVEGADLHGGFAGHETDFNQMDTIANKTYIDAMGSGRPLTQDKAFERPTEWAGVILQNGLVSGIDYDVYGGGAYLKKNGILRYSTIKNNTALATSNYNMVNAYGGGIYMEEGAALHNSTIDGNTAQIVDNSGGEISNGVAQGGGVNNVGNRLNHLIVRNNRTISETNTDGGAIYSSGDVINSVVNNNNGNSAIYLLNNSSIVNSTIVANSGQYTIHANRIGNLKNSIVYNNNITTTDLFNIEYKEFNNLINVNPDFKADSFELEYTSQARAIGNTTFFPKDLDKDLAGNSRTITLKGDTQAIDAGAYQSDIKVVSATATTIEVPFGTVFGDLGLKSTIIGLLEFGYSFDADIAWKPGEYNELLPGSYTLYGTLSNLGDGITNPDLVEGQITVIVKENHNAEIEGLRINGDDWLNSLGSPYIIDCEYTSEIVNIEIDMPLFATIEFSPEVKYTQEENKAIVEIDATKPGNYQVDATITSQNKENKITHPILLTRHFPFWSIIEQRWNNTFVINNNKETNGGYEFVSYKWYRNNQEIGIKQYYSAGPKKTDLLDETSLYHAKMIDINGVEYETCKDSPLLTNSGLQIYPNPVRIGEKITVKAPLKEGQKGNIHIYSLSGIIISKTDIQGELTEIDSPTNQGIYILRISLENGASESVRVIVY